MEWITERMPTEEDADERGEVLIRSSWGGMRLGFQYVVPGEPWMPTNPNDRTRPGFPSHREAIESLRRIS